MSATVAMTRRVAFSAGHRYELASLSEAENRALFGPWFSRFNHGHNYVLYVTVAGAVDAQTGMVVNIKRVDDRLKSGILAELDGRSLNDEVSHFRDRPSTLEYLLRYLRQRLTEDLADLPQIALTHLRLDEHPLLYAELDVSRGPMTLTRIYEFAASHRLHAPALSEEENRRLFGKCNNPAGHGHNYVLEVTVTGEPDAATGMLVDLNALDARVTELVVDRYDHRNLNEDLEEFRGRVTTSEVVAQEIYRRLDGALPARLARVRLHETARNIFEVAAANPES